MKSIMNKLMPPAPAPKKKIVNFGTPKKVNTIKASGKVMTGRNATKVAIKKTKFQK